MLSLKMKNLSVPTWPSSFLLLVFHIVIALKPREDVWEASIVIAQYRNGRDQQGDHIFRDGTRTHIRLIFHCHTFLISLLSCVVSTCINIFANDSMVIKMGYCLQRVLSLLKFSFSTLQLPTWGTLNIPRLKSLIPAPLKQYPSMN